MNHLIDYLLTDGVLQRVVLVSSLFHGQFRPLREPRIWSKRHDCDCTTACNTQKLFDLHLGNELVIFTWITTFPARIFSRWESDKNGGVRFVEKVIQVFTVEDFLESLCK